MPGEIFDLTNVFSAGIHVDPALEVEDSLLAFWTLGAFGNELVAVEEAAPPGVGYGGRISRPRRREPRDRGLDLLLMVHLSV